LFTLSSPAVLADSRASPLSAPGPAEPQVTEVSPLLTAAGEYTAYFPIVFKQYPPPIAYFYSFTEPACDGWALNDFDTDDPDPPGPWVAFCGTEFLDDRHTTNGNGVYSIKTVAAWNSWIYTAPIQLADPRNFTITVDGQAAQGYMWLSSWGVYFNANADRTKFYSVQIYQNGVPELATSPEYSVRRWIHFRGTAIDENVELQNKKKCPLCGNDSFQWNRITIQRIGDLVYIFAGDAQYPWAYNYLLTVLSMPEYTTNEYVGVGVFQGNFEWMDWNGNIPTFQVDNFYAYPVYRR
jgi:hypothetical protein